MSLSKDPSRDPRPGDWVQARRLPGQGSRHGQIVEVLGRAGHKRYRVRSDERHESIVFPAEGMTGRSLGERTTVVSGP